MGARSASYTMTYKSELRVCRDTQIEWARDAETRKSTSGGLTFLGSHAISWYSRVQARVALSSCEVELNAMVKCMTECLHVKHLGQAFWEKSHDRTRHRRFRRARGLDAHWSWEVEAFNGETALGASLRISR